MEREETLFSSLPSDLKQRTLYRGIWIGSLGLLFLLYMGGFGSRNFIDTWGLLGFLCGIALIAIGLIPVRRMQRLETSPHAIELFSSHCTLHLKQLKGISISYHLIQSLEFVEENSNYFGIGINLKDQSTLSLTTRRYINRCQKRFGCDLFLPYFKKNGASTLKQYLSSDPN